MALAQQAKPLPGSDDCLGCHDTGPRTGKRQAGSPTAVRRGGSASLAACRPGVHELPQRARQEGVSAPRKAGPGGLRRVPCATNRRSTPPACTGRRGPRRPAGARLQDCHGTHNILRPSSPNSPTSTMEIPRLCGRCHHEGTAGQPDARHPAEQHPGATTRTASTARGCSSGASPSRRSARAATRRTSCCRTPIRALPSPNRTSPRPARSAMRRSRPCTAKSSAASCGRSSRT